MNDRIMELARRDRPLAEELLREAVRIPADFVDRPPEDGGDPHCGLSNHEGPRLEYLRRRIVEVGAVDRAEDVGFDTFGNLVWTVSDPGDGIPEAEKAVIFFDGHTDTVQALRGRWREATGGLDAYDGLVDAAGIDRSFLRKELGYLPPDDDWQHLVWGRGAADQLGGVICQIVATRILRELRSEGALRGCMIRSYGTVAEEDNDGGGPMAVMRRELAGAGPERIPDVVVLTEGTGDATEGAVGIYRGQRGRMQIEVVVTGRSCHGSMPWEGRNPLEYGAAIIAEAADRYRRGDGFADDPFLGGGTRTASFSTLDTPSDCAVPERFTFRFDRRLTAGENPEAALRDVETLEAVACARSAGLTVVVQAPRYAEPTWLGARPDNQQIYPGWVTPEDHPAVLAAVDAYRQVGSPQIPAGGTLGALRKEPRVSRWIFSTDGVGFPVPVEDAPFPVPAGKRWVSSGAYHHPAIFGIGPGLEQNTHKIGEYVDGRELPVVIACLARFPRLYAEATRG
jgi:acetylornithine deacetylase/succinyl-diaminopimelate desuccinylase-like protein